MYIGTYKGEIEIYDEATEKMVDKIALKTGIPRSITPSPDRTRFYALNSRFEEIEVIDIASRKTIDSFKLSSGNKHVRVNNLQPDPNNKFLILMYRTATKLVDRWEIGPPTIQQYDLATHQFTRVIPWPGGDERENVNMRLGPDGKHLFLFGDEVTVLETTNFTEVESWPFAAPTEPGLGRINVGPSHDFYDPPGTFTGLFTMQDAVQKRRLMGIGRVDLVNRKVDFQPIGPASRCPVRQVARRQTRLRAGPGHRPLRDVDLRPGETGGAEAHRVRGPAADGRARQLQRQAGLRLRRRRHRGHLGRGQPQVPAHDGARRRPDDRAVRGARPGSGDDLGEPIAAVRP